MISRDMYRLLNRLPRWPSNKSFEELDKVLRKDDFAGLGLLMNAKERGLVGCNGKEEDKTNGFYLTEEGKEAIDEYARGQSASRLSKIAILLSIAGLLISLASFLGCGVQ